MTQPSIIFHDAGDFCALRAAERFLASAGFSVGSGCKGCDTGILFGDWVIAKWRNLTRSEQAVLHGVMTGDRRNGPVMIRLTVHCPPEGRKAFLDAASELEGIA